MLICFLASAVNPFPNEMASNGAKNHYTPKKGEHNPIWHPSCKLPKFYQPCEEKETNNEPNDELWNIGNSNGVEHCAASE
jgi:hypothetical protein